MTLSVADAGFAAASFAVCVVAGLIAKRATSRPLESVGGSPRYTWRVGLAFQAVVFPLVVAAAYWSWRASPSSWLSHGWHTDALLGGDGASLATRLPLPAAVAEAMPFGSHRPFERLFCYIMLGYFMKDIMTPMDAVFVLHHVVSIATIVAVMAMPEGVGYFVSTAMALEVGSGILSWKNLKPTPWRWDVCVGVCTASNLAGMVLLLMFFTSPGEVDIMRGTLVFVGAALIIVRQLIAMSEWVDARWRSPVAGAAAVAAADAAAATVKAHAQ
uniref:TLC domain-containing protein n=1 Tax=Bicosoecida sp. CB-2014 TaxID=1486930 RepID=A0A7S1C4C6_9STRA|mmetsp:Transcript_11564/g.40455  ORF Transcript_11564/g.40455 Transcript_11564/m.40455 type:complete len:272 (+) Transcript_11564:237-1052(+)